MSKYQAAFVVIGIVAMGAVLVSVSGKTAAPAAGSWQVDSQHSAAQLVTDGTTNFGNTKLNFTVGFARVDGDLKLDDNDPTNSRVDFHIWPADSTVPVIGEDGKIKAQWYANLANHTLVAFHSNKVVRTPDGKVQATGNLVVTRVDRNVDIEPNEAYRGPVYGPPMVHKVVREATFVFDLSTPSGQKGELQALGSTSVSRENFPELVKVVVSTDWPPVVMDEKCQNPSGGTEDYRGFRCTGTFMEASGLPPAPVRIGEDYPGPSDYNSIIGNQMTIMVSLHLKPATAGTRTAGSM
jgi:polyisoprenoid-binding protein YceI